VIGQTIRNFEVKTEIGSGGYGVVYRAYQTNVERDVAIKVILPQYAKQPEFVSNFEAEAKLVAQLEHPRIVPLYDYWQDENGAFLVMRYIRGGSLRDMIAKQGALPLNKVLRLVEQIADALHASHEAGVVHRDLKPDNILIDQRGNAYLTDFGIAKQLGDENASATDAIKGTFAYLSPEQIQQSDVSPQTDIYALGIMLYEMLTGQHPYHGTPIGIMVMKHLQENLPDVRDLRDDLSGEVDDIIQRATAKEASQRYESTLALISELKSAISGAPITTLQQPVAPIVKKKPTTTDERNRFAMLENVRKFWVEGVLENSLHNTAMIDLGMKSESGAVDNPWDTLIRTPSGDESLTDNSISQVFDRMNGKLLILGDPGGGTTTTLLTLTRELLYRAEVDEQHPIPVVFNLSSWSEKQLPLNEWLIDELNTKYQVPRKVGTKWVEDDELLLLLDGLDEVAEDVHNVCVEVINDYRSEHGFVDVVVCSRIKDYDALSDQLKLNGAIVIQPLDETQIVTYLDALGADVTVVRELITRDAQLRELATSPLMLSIMLLAYRGKSSSDVPDFDNIEAQRQHLFEVYVERMFDRRIGDKPYTNDETRNYLRQLASQLQAHAHSIFHIEELQTDWLKQESHKKRFVNTIFVTIYLLQWLGLMITFAGLILVFGSQLLRFGVESQLPYSTSILFGIGLSLIIATMPTVSAYRHTKSTPITTVETVQWSFNTLKQNVGKKIGINILISILFFVMTYIFLSILFDARAGLAGFSIALSHLITYIHSTGFSTSGVGNRVQPNQGMWTSLRNMFQVGIYTIILFSLSAVLVFSIIYDLQMGLIVGTYMAISSVSVILTPDVLINPGGLSVLQHVILRRLLEREGQIPRNLAQFLDYTSSLILMRKVGGGYIFIHRYLLEYFADLEDRDE